MSVAVDPLVATPPSEVPLLEAPLVRVLAQLRFPEILSVEKREFVAPFQEAIRSAYPILRPEQTQGFVFGPAGMAPSKLQTVWRFSDLDSQWRVSLAPEFLSLETSVYTSRADFMERLRVVSEALALHIDPKQLDRLGVRYVDRLTGDDVRDIEHLVRPEVRGLLGTPGAASAVLALSESVFRAEGGEAQLLARWGLLPAGQSVDPSTIEPAHETSWILDLDMFSTKSEKFDPAAIVRTAAGYAERIYTLFRWAVTDTFLERFGGKP